MTNICDVARDIEDKSRLIDKHSETVINFATKDPGGGFPSERLGREIDELCDMSKKMRKSVCEMPV